MSAVSAVLSCVRRVSVLTRVGGGQAEAERMLERSTQEIQAEERES